MNKETIINLEEELRQAMLNSDVEKLNLLIADSLIFTIPGGIIANKQMDLNAHKSGIQKLSKLKLLEQRIELFTGFAVVAARMVINGSYNGSSINGEYAYTRVWVNFKESWQVVAGHVSLI